MGSDTPTNCSPSTLLRVLVPLLDADVLSHLGKLLQLSKLILARRRHEGLYEVFSHEVQLELLDAMGKKAVYTKHQRVRFLQNGITAYQDQAWGVGNIFAEYQCSPGIPVDRYQEGYRHFVLISLRQTKHYGDVETFHIRRVVTDGFIKPVEHFQTHIDHPTKTLSMALIFPARNPPRSVQLIEQNSTRSLALGPTHCMG